MKDTGFNMKSASSLCWGKRKPDPFTSKVFFLPIPYIMPCKHSPVDPPQSCVSFSQESCAGLKLPSLHLEMHPLNVLFETLGHELCSHEVILQSPRISSGETEVNQAFAVTCLISYHVFKFIIPAFLPVLPSHVLGHSILCLPFYFFIFFFKSRVSYGKGRAQKHKKTG